MQSRLHIRLRLNHVHTTLLIAFAGCIALFLLGSYRKEVFVKFSGDTRAYAFFPARLCPLTPPAPLSPLSAPHGVIHNDSADVMTTTFKESTIPRATPTPVKPSIRPIPSTKLVAHSVNAVDAPYSAVILYLVSWKRVSELIVSLSYVLDNLPLKYPWPIILLHPGDFDDPIRQTAVKRALYDYINKGNEAWAFVDRLEFVQIHFSLPEGIPSDRSLLEPIVFKNRWPGYHHMCAFYASQIFDHPRLLNVTYYLRLDTDSYIYEPACFDPFERMHERNLSYAYRIPGQDVPDVVVGMYELIKQYSDQQAEVKKTMTLNDWTLPAPEDFTKRFMPTYYNNFEIVKLARFRTPEIRHWFDEVNSVPERFYKWRWGDAPLRFATVSMFLDRKMEVEELCSLPYFHQSMARITCPCEATSLH